MHKLLLLIPHLSKGGQERVASRLSLELSKYYEIYFALFDKKITYPYNGYILHLDSPTRKNIFLKTVNVINRISKLEKLVRELKPKVVISFGETANLVNLLTPKKDMTIISIRQDIWQASLNSVIKNIYLNIYRTFKGNVNKVITTSKILEYKFLKYLKYPPQKLRTIYNPIEVEEVRKKSLESLETLSFLKNYPYLVNIGRLTLQKGQWYLLRIFKELKRKQKELKLVLLGEGELKNYLIELSENLGLKTYVWDRDKLHEGYDVYFLGFQKNPYKFVKQAKAFVFSSLWEGFPNVVAESLAVGKAVISSDCRTGPREILAPDTDFLKETKEPEFARYGVLMPTFERRRLKANEKLTREEKIWIDTLEGLLEEKKTLKEYEKKAPQRAFDFHIDKIAKQWIEVIEQS